MNDLNTVYLVGTLTMDATKIDELGYVHVLLCNNQYRYDERIKEYDNEQTIVEVLVKAEESVVSHLKKHTRVGINGRLQRSISGLQVMAFTVQLLDDAPHLKDEQEE